MFDEKVVFLDTCLEIVSPSAPVLRWSGLCVFGRELDVTDVLIVVFELGPVLRLLGPLTAEEVVDGAVLLIGAGWFDPIIVGICFLGAAALMIRTFPSASNVTTMFTQKNIWKCCTTQAGSWISC